PARPAGVAVTGIARGEDQALELDGAHGRQSLLLGDELGVVFAAVQGHDAPAQAHEQAPKPHAQSSAIAASIKPHRSLGLPLSQGPIALSSLRPVRRAADREAWAICEYFSWQRSRASRALSLPTPRSPIQIGETTGSSTCASPARPNTGTEAGMRGTSATGPLPGGRLTGPRGQPTPSKRRRRR